MTRLSGAFTTLHVANTRLAEIRHDGDTMCALTGFAAGMVIGNGAIALATVIARRTPPRAASPSIDGVKHLEPIDAGLWRSSAPSRDAFTVLVECGVRTVVDLRADHDLRDDAQFLHDVGVQLVRLPIRDGQTPTPEQVETFLETARTADGIVLLHCGAGVGRTGTMVAAYLVATGAATPLNALWRNLAVGPPSLEQIWYVARLDRGFDQPKTAVKIVSRLLDAPRRIWSRVRSLSRR